KRPRPTSLSASSAVTRVAGPSIERPVWTDDAGLWCRAIPPFPKGGTMSTLIEKYEFESPINLEGSWGLRPITDKAKSVMEFYLNTDDTGHIEWDVPDLDLFECIGLTFEIDPTGKRKLIDYDGVMSFPEQARALLEKHGIDTSEITG